MSKDAGIWRALVAPTLGGKQMWADVHVHDRLRIQRHVLSEHHRLLGPGDRRLASGTFETCRDALEAWRPDGDLWPGDRHLVLLLHGYLRAKDAFKPMTRALEDAGFAAVPVNYPSMWRGLEDHADQLRAVLHGLKGRPQVSFVGHSMGGLVVRLALDGEEELAERLRFGRLVMLGVPNQGAELADKLSGSWFYRTLGGPASTQLTTRHVPSLPPPPIPFGSIAGIRGNGRGYNPLLTGEDDGIVTLESTRMEGAEDTLVVESLHALLMWQPQVIEATLSYLRTGRFGVEDRDKEQATAIV